MLSETTNKTTQSSSDANKHKPFDREVRDMVNAITSRVGDLHKPGASHHHRQTEEDEHGIRIITLAGTNTGATMRSELDEKGTTPQGVSGDDQPEALGTYVNSNFQAVNNSIMFGSSYSTNDPGVHLDISDFFEQPHGHKPDRHARKGKKKETEAFKSDQQTEHSD
ncbi:uncharacterized protein LOC8278482 [Ricinus communis]|uniref:Uncharacterized protein n=1 Tax=Ricinus communis TaxID=3988 RepID=B9RYY5_RICCO|nr:uncharacterized protein LOC8278482 [Ricinus communis]EEF43487.1 conserved hypothetical protein [Ricinus communis]|eukprot:XP_002518954.1 uncharacterized protein LOC8278482 [Ricinus communis]